MDKTSLVLMIGGIAFIVFVVMLWSVNYNERQKEAIKALEEKYKQALLEGNKEEAIGYGRQYYSKLHKGELNSQDEEAILKVVADIAGEE